MTRTKIKPMSYHQVHRDPLQADHHLDFSSRKHSRASTVDSDWQSDESSRFDDAEESESDIHDEHGRSPSTHSAKRRRSKDWPLQPDETPTPTDHGNHHRWPFKPQNPSRGRRSRFVEADMNDSDSEAPPSIFLRQDAEGPATANATNTGQRQSGIFRFGKVIASAFNPFGVWGNVSEIWRTSQTESRPENDPRVRAEKAYAELKKAGYKGTVKGSYLQSLQDGGHPVDPTQRTGQRWDGSMTLGRHSRQISADGYGSGNSICTPGQELRKTRSSLGIPSIKRVSEDSERPEVHKSKSRKELQRQAKLLKRVSDLEGKLERARKELRELTGEEKEEELLVRSLFQERPYPRKFVPGALPSLPSERFYLNQAATDTDAAEPGPLAIMSENVQRRPQEPSRKASTRVSPKPSSVVATESPLRKRKSPEPKSAREKAPQKNEDSLQPEPVRANETDTPRKATKIGKSDSPGSVERKKSQDHAGSDERQPRGRNQRQVRQRSHTRSPSRRRSTSRGRAPRLRMKKGQTDLRSASANRQGDLTENQAQHGPQPLDLEPDDGTASTPTSTPVCDYENIPPVPPLPKNLAATAAKVDRRLAREMWKLRNANAQMAKDQTVDQTMDEDFRWPDGFF